MKIVITENFKKTTATVLFTVATLSLSLVVSGCNSTVESNADYFSHLDTIPFNDVSTFRFATVPLKMGSYQDSSIEMLRYAMARVEGDDDVLLITYVTRSDMPNVVVASSEYYFKDTGNELTLVNHIARQTGLIGSWKIPVLHEADIKKLAASGAPPQNSKWMKLDHKTNIYSIGQSLTMNGISGTAYLGVSEGQHNGFRVTNSIVDTISPVVAIYREVQSCHNLGLMASPLMVKISINNIPFQSVGSCFTSPIFKGKGHTARYELDESAISYLQTFEITDSNLRFTIADLSFDTSIVGFNYALGQMRLVYR
ncbi:hypothetical protein [Vibrio anguillarum]|uniref:Lipoprotein n=2 Tax=Vibrio anguillarum TaxID=55601 RepID=A0ABR9Z7H1_VIBAN|nr:hypothetical protein [Vibrio anguillarum]MBF4374398.1 hypothetical protein [Vibrio anguillarum]